MTRYVATNGDNVYPLRDQLDDMGAALAAFVAIPMPTSGAGSHFEKSWSLDADGGASVWIYEYVAVGRGFRRRTYTRYRVTRVEVEAATELVDTTTGAHYGRLLFETDGRLTVVPYRDLLSVDDNTPYAVQIASSYRDTDKLGRFFIACAEQGVTIEKVPS